MSLLDDAQLPLSLLRLYSTASYPCSYLPGREARSQVAAPTALIDHTMYTYFIQRGFRRSGLFTYRPNCQDCQACVPIRLAVADLKLGRTQKRIWRKHNNLQAIEMPLEFYSEHFALYTRYQTARHSGGDMDHNDREQYTQFLLQSRADTKLISFRDEQRLRMVSIVDVLQDGLSAVYTFFDPKVMGASFGTYGILWQIDLCIRLGLPYLYLGYYIEGSRKMAYKANFFPAEFFIDGTWQREAH